MPLLLFVIMFTVQLALVFLGNQAAGAAAREAARVARSAGDPEAGSPGALNAGTQRGLEYARSVGRGLITNVQIQVTAVNGPEGAEVQAVVVGRGIQLVPGIPGMTIRQTVRGPVEVFHPDTVP